jgi:hypothetical protein
MHKKYGEKAIAGCIILNGSEINVSSVSDTLKSNENSKSARKSSDGLLDFSNSPHESNCEKSSDGQN